ncbi:MAG TPA: VOC family protein [Gemmatimonadales bacterium]|nr:VOC family protein [Gemmatimonadales bacterium]
MTSATLYSAAIFVTDIERAIAFYRDTLKLPLAKQGTFGAEFFAEGTRLGVHPANHPNAKAMVGRDTGLVLHIPGILDYCSDLMDAGVTFVSEPTRQEWGIMALVADPDGNRIALWEQREEKTPE